MTPDEIYIGLGVAALLICLAIRISLWRAGGCGLRPPAPTPEPEPVAWHWCAGCTTAWPETVMGWTSAGTYRCELCLVSFETRVNPTVRSTP